MRRHYDFLSSMRKQDMKFNTTKDMIQHQQAEQASVETIMNYRPSSRDIMNETVNKYMMQKKQEVKSIHQKYCLGLYKHHGKSIAHVVKDKVKELSNKVIDTIKDTLDGAVTKISGKTKSQWTSKEKVMKHKIMQKDGLYDKHTVFSKSLDKYDKSLDDYIKAIYESTNMKLADSNAFKLKSYYDKYFPVYCAEAKDVLEQFEVDVMGNNDG